MRPRIPFLATALLVVLVALSAAELTDDLARLSTELGRAADDAARLDVLARLTALLEEAEAPQNTPPALVTRLLDMADRAAEPALRRESVTVLGLLGDPDAAPTLVRLLRDDADFGVRRAAVDALARVGDRADAALIADSVLGGEPSSDYQLRAGAYRALGALGLDDEVRLLSLFRRGLADPYPAVRQAALEMLRACGLAAEIGQPELRRAYEFETASSVRGELLVTLAVVDGEQTLELIETALGDPELRADALRALAAVPPSGERDEAADLLDEAFADSTDNLERLEIAGHLVELQRREAALEALTALLLEDPPGDEERVLELLRENGHPAALETTADFVIAEPAVGLATMRAAVGLLGDADLLAAADEDQLEDADEALSALLRQKHDAALYADVPPPARAVEAAWRERFDDEDWNDRLRERVELLDELEEPAALEALTILLGRGEEPVLVDELNDYLESEPTEPRAVAALHALGLGGSPEALPLLTEYARSSRPGDVQLSVAALEALGELGLPESAPVLTQVLEDPATPPLRLTAAARACAAVADPNLLFPLLEVLEGAVEPESRRAAAYALAAFSEPQALAPLARVLRSDASPRVRREAFVAYCHNLPANPGDEQLLPLSQYLSTNDPGDDQRSWTAVELLFTKLGAERIEELLEHPQPSVRRLTVQYLTRRAAPGDRELLEGALADPNLLVNIAAARGLGELGDSAAAGALKTAFNQTFDLYYASTKDSSHSTVNVDKLRRTIEDAFLRLSINPAEVAETELDGPQLDNGPDEEPENRRMEVVVDALRLRDAPSTATGNKIGMLYLDDVVEVLSVQDNWAEVRTADERAGWACIELEGETFLRDTERPLVPPTETENESENDETDSDGEAAEGD